MEEEEESDSPRWWFYASIAAILIVGGGILSYLWVSTYGFPSWMRSSSSVVAARASQDAVPPQDAGSQRVVEGKKKVQELEEAVEESRKLQEETLQKEELKRQEEQRRQEEQQRHREEQRRQEEQRRRQEEEQKLREKEAAVHEEMVHFTLWSGGDPPWEIAMWIRENDGSVGGSLALYKQGDMREITGQWDGMAGSLHFSPGRVPQWGDGQAKAQVVDKDDVSWLVLDGTFHEEYRSGKEERKFKEELGLMYHKRLRAADIGAPEMFNAMWTETAEWRSGQNNLFVALATGGEGFPNFVCLNVVGSLEARTKEQYQVNVRSVQSLGGMGMISLDSLGTAADAIEQRRRDLIGRTISVPTGKVLLLPNDFVSLERVVALDTDDTTTLRALNAGYKVFEKAFDLALSKGLGSAPGRETSGREERRGSSSDASQPSVFPPLQSAVTLSGTVLFRDEKTGSYKPRGGVIVMVDDTDIAGMLLTQAASARTDEMGKFSIRVTRNASLAVYIKEVRGESIWNRRFDRDTDVEIKVNRNTVNVRQR